MSPAPSAQAVVSEAHRALTQENAWLNVSRPLSPNDLEGRIVLVDFWTFCCINCIHVMPDLKALEAGFKDDLTVIGVHSAKFDNEKDSESIRQAILRNELEHPVINDSSFKVWQSFGVRAWPTLILLDPDGRIEASYSGEGHREELKADIERLRKKFAGKLKKGRLPVALESAKLGGSPLRFPGKLAWAEDEKLLFVSDSNHNRIVGLKLAEDGEAKVQVVIGSGLIGRRDGTFEQALFHRPQGIAYRDHVLYVADTENHLLRKIDFAQKKVETIAGTGQQGFERVTRNISALDTPLSSPWDLAFMGNEANSKLAIAMAGTHQLWAYDLVQKKLSILAGNGRESIEDGRYPENSLSQPSGLSWRDGKLYFVDAETSSLRVFESGEIKTLVGSGLFDFGFKDGEKGSALLQHPLGVLATEQGVFIADTYNHAIRKYDPTTKKTSTVSGLGKKGHADGNRSQASFFEPSGLAWVGERLLVADSNNHRIREVDIRSGSAKTLKVIEQGIKDSMATPRHATPSAFLPQVKKASETTLASEGSAVLFRFEEGWNINKEAPSWLAVYDSGSKLVQEYSVAEVRAHKLNLPRLKEGQKYRLQGSFYYCKEEKVSACLIESRDLTFKASSKSQAHELVIELKDR